MPTSAKLGLLGSLYFSQGLPFGFFTQALPVMLRKQGHSLEEIGLLSLLAAPWALKFVWAPAADRYWWPRIGRRRSWILPLQLLSVLTLGVLALGPAAASVPLLMAAVLLLNLLAATQDISTDGLAVDILAPHERGLANGLQVAGYRVGMIVGGGVLLILFERLGSVGVFSCMALLTAAASVPVLLAHEPPQSATPEPKTSHSLHFLRRPGALRLLILVATYKAGDAFATGMLRPFLADSGFTLEDVGWLLGTVGFVCGLVGALWGGSLVNRIGRRTALLVFGLLQSLTVAGYSWIAFAKPGRHAIYALCGIEHLAGGMATAALFTCMMDWCSKETSATDYTVQASAVVIATGLASAVAGFSAGALGYPAHFALAAALALGSLVAVARCFPTKEQAAHLCAARVEGSCA
ncbi:MAG: MFS transporter [Deltaproteobacteria bacterium]|nr:MFS transporter [Deltaproteobacteria bacterium]